MAGSESLLKMEHRIGKSTAEKLGCALAQGSRAGAGVGGCPGDRLQSVSEQLAALESQPQPSSKEQAEGRLGAGSPGRPHGEQ